MVRGGWNRTILSPKTGSEAASNYGTLSVLVNKDLKLGILNWMGNSTTAVAGDYEFSLPSGSGSKYAVGVPVRNANQLYAYLSNVVVRLESNNNSSGSVVYLLED